MFPKVLVFLFLFLLPLQSSAVTPIKKGEESPTDGYVFSKEEEAKNRQHLVEKVHLEQLNVLKDSKLEIQEQRIEVYKTYMNETKKLNPLGTWEKVGYFFLGVLATGVSVYTSTIIIEKTRK